MISIAIDGPAGAGKSTIARKVAKALGYIYVDTGALYRAIGLYAVNQCITTSDREAVATALPDITVDLKHVDGYQRVYLNGHDVSDAIRKPVVSAAASHVSAHPEVRAYLLQFQHQIAETSNVIMDGRDVGTVVLPNADIKIYLTASAEERAKRRYQELTEAHFTASYKKILEEIIERDNRDMTRSVSPLKKADDAILLDTSNCTLEEGIALVKQTILDRLAQIQK